MAGQGGQIPASTARSTPAVNSGLDYINGHGNLPDAPSSNSAVNNAAPAAMTVPLPATKKGAKGKKAADPNETGKLLAAKINQLELDAVEEKDQELEIGSWCGLEYYCYQIWKAFLKANVFVSRPRCSHRLPTPVHYGHSLDRQRLSSSHEYQC